MKNDEFEYVDDRQQPKKNKALLIVIIIVLVIGAVFAIFKFGGFELPWMNNEDKELKEYIKDLASQNKGYSKESDLIIPEFQIKEISKVRDIVITLSDLDADSSGYIFDMTLKNQSDDNITFDCTTVLIDGFETSEVFTVDISAFSEEKVKVNIKKSELLQLDIRDFNKLTFKGFVIPEGLKKRSFKFDVMTIQLDPVNNEKVGLTKIDEIEDLALNYYKKVEDNNNYYLYFDLKNNSKDKNYNVYVDKLLLAGKIFETDIELIAKFESEKIFYVSIPKDMISSFDNFDVSFFVVKTVDNNEKEIYITNSKKIYL